MIIISFSPLTFHQTSEIQTPNTGLWKRQDSTQKGMCLHAENKALVERKDFKIQPREGIMK